MIVSRDTGSELQRRGERERRGKDEKLLSVFRFVFLFSPTGGDWYRAADYEIPSSNLSANHYTRELTNSFSLFFQQHQQTPHSNNVTLNTCVTPNGSQIPPYFVETESTKH